MQRKAISLRKLRLRHKLSLLIALVVSIAVLSMGISSELLLRQSFMDHTRLQLFHALQRLEANLGTIESDLKVSAQLAAKEDLLIASVQLINQYQDKSRYNAVLLDEEKKLLAKSALDRVKFSQSSDLTIYDQNGELLAFAGRKAGIFRLGYLSFADGKSQLLVRSEADLEFMPALRSEYELLDDHHIARHAHEASSLEPVISYHRVGAWLVVKSHQNIWDPLAKQSAGNLEFSYVLDGDYMSRLSSDLGVKIVQSFDAPNLRVTEASGQQLSLDALQISELNGLYGVAIEKGEPGSHIYFTAAVGKGNENELIERQRRQTLLTLLAIGVGLLLVMNQLFRRSLVLPLGQLMEQIHRVRKGEYSPLLPPKTGDEIEEVGHSINSLANALADRETALKQSENRSRALAEVLQEAQAISQLGSWTLDLANESMEWSAQIYQLLGLDAETVTPHYQMFVDAVHPEDREKVHPIYADAQINHVAFRIEHRLTAPGNRTQWVSAQCRFETNASGQAVRAIGTMQDITERKLAEIALADSNNLLMTVIDSIPLRVFWKDSQLRYLGCNTLFSGDAGKAGPGEVIGHDDFQMGWAEQAELYRADDRQLIASGESKLSYEEPQTTPDGRTMWLRTSKIPLKKSDGQVFGLVGIYEDITQRKSIEEQLRKLSQVAEQSPESIIITDLSGKIEYVNPAFLLNTGYEVSEVLGRNPNMLKSGMTPNGTYAQMWSALRQGTSWSGELINRRKDDSIFTEWAVISPLRDAAGHTTHYVAVQEDITEKKRIATELDEYRQGLELLVTERTLELTSARKQADESNLAKSQFLANMSHEIRTPLGAISGMARLISREPLSATQSDKLWKLEAAVKHLGATINDILDLSKIEANSLVLEESPLAVQAVVDNIANMLQQTVDDKGLKLILEVDRMPVGLVGDATRLGQALLNYASNAVKFTDAGSVTLRCRVAEDVSEAVVLRFEVQDTGLGISPEKQSKLFTPFVQADATTTRKFGGTGLGLAITKRLIAAMGGEVGVESEVGRGSLFWFTVKLKKADAQALNALSEPQELAEAQMKALFSGRRVLLAEDDDFNREIGTILLEDLGFVVDVAEDGQAAYEKAVGANYDLILMDMQMPKMDGLEATRRIRSERAGKPVPIVAMTANAFAEDRVRCLEAGMSDFLTKPVDPALLHQTLLRQLTKNAA